MIERCFVYRHEGHRWWDCHYLKDCCYFYEEYGHFRRNCPYWMQTQSQSQYIIMDKIMGDHTRPAQSGDNISRGRR